jgi:hypothetical protein
MSVRAATSVPESFAAQIAAVHGATPQRIRELRGRYLALHLDALRAREDVARLPGAPPTWQEQTQRWSPRALEEPGAKLPLHD